MPDGGEYLSQTTPFPAKGLVSQSKNVKKMWRFPKIGVPPNHPFKIGFSIVNHPFLGSSI
jgi:hypothetical protein